MNNLFSNETTVTTVDAIPAEPNGISETCGTMLKQYAIASIFEDYVSFLINTTNLTRNEISTKVGAAISTLMDRGECTSLVMDLGLASVRELPDMTPDARKAHHNNCLVMCTMKNFMCNADARTEGLADDEKVMFNELSTLIRECASAKERAVAKFGPLVNQVIDYIFSSYANLFEAEYINPSNDRA